MKLSLASQDQTLLATAMSTLVSPLVQPSFKHWQREVNRSLRPLLGADKTSFMCPIDDREIRSESDAVSSAVLDDYVRERFPAADRRWGIRRRSLELGAFNRATLYGNRLGELYRSEYYNEYLAPLGAYDVLGLAACFGASDRAALIYCHHDRPTGRHFGKRGLALMRLLYPAFKSGIHAARSLLGQRHSVTQITDAMPSGVMLADSHGRILHRNTALQQMTQAERSWSDVEREIHAALRACLVTITARRAVRPNILEPQRTLRRVRGAHASYTVNAVPIHSDPLATDAQVVIVVERIEPPAFPEHALRARYRLTARELDVVRLLSEGLHNVELAMRLGISDSTARHHTESVLLKLGLHSRAQVAGAIASLARDALLGLCDERRSRVT